MIYVKKRLDSLIIPDMINEVENLVSSGLTVFRDVDSKLILKDKVGLFILGSECTQHKIRIGSPQEWDSAGMTALDVFYYMPLLES